MHGKETWALVADGGRARILRGLNILGEPRGHQAAAADIVHEAAHLRTSDYGTDKPGRSYASVGSRRSSMEATSDPVRVAEQDFASQLIDELETHLNAGDFDRLALIAAPRMLGDLRAALPASLKDKVITEIAKDLTKTPAVELRAAVIALIEENHTL